MTCKVFAACAAALLTLGLPARADTPITELSASIILLGEPAPAEAAAAEAVPEQTSYRRKTPDVLAGGERREMGVPRTPAAKEMPVAEDETTAAIDAPAEEAEDAGTPPGYPLEDSELRLGN